MSDVPDPSGLLDQHQLARELGVTPRRVRQMRREGMSAVGGPGKYRFELSFCQRWMEQWLLDHHGGKREGAGRKKRGQDGEPAADDSSRSDPPKGGKNQSGAPMSALDRAIAGGMVLERPEDIRALLGKVSAREAATIRSMVASMRQLHDLQVEQRKYVLVSDVEAAWKRLVQDAVSLMDDAAKRAADLVASRLKIGAAERAAIQSTMAGELGRVRDTLAERNA